jgi:hypothetical protein
MDTCSIVIRLPAVGDASSFNIMAVHVMHPAPASARQAGNSSRCYACSICSFDRQRPVPDDLVIGHNGSICRVGTAFGPAPAAGIAHSTVLSLPGPWPTSSGTLRLATARPPAGQDQLAVFQRPAMIWCSNAGSKVMAEILPVSSWQLGDGPAQRLSDHLRQVCSWSWERSARASDRHLTDGDAAANGFFNTLDEPTERTVGPNHSPTSEAGSCAAVDQVDIFAGEQLIGMPLEGLGQMRDEADSDRSRCSRPKRLSFFSAGPWRGVQAPSSPRPFFAAARSIAETCRFSDPFATGASLSRSRALARCSDRPAAGPGER